MLKIPFFRAQLFVMNYKLTLHTDYNISMKTDTPSQQAQLRVDTNTPYTHTQLRVGTNTPCQRIRRRPTHD